MGHVLSKPLFSIPQKLKLKPFPSEDNPDLLEVCSSKVQTSDSPNRLVTDTPAPKIFNYSSFMDPNTKVTLLRGSPCHSVVSTKKQADLEIDSSFSVRSEGSTSLRCLDDHKAFAEIKGMDLNVLF